MFNIDWEPFNGMAHRPWLMFLGLIFCIIAWAAGLFLCIFSGYNVTSENETTLVETSFVAYETSKDELHLSVPGSCTAYDEAGHISDDRRSHFCRYAAAR